MSYTLIAYMIDLPQLRSAVGGKDAALVRAVRKTNPAKFDADEDGLSLGDALEQLVMGREPGKKATHQYGYALEHLCRHLGKMVPVDLWSGVRWEAMEDSGVAEIMNSGPPVKLPKIPDFPLIAFLDRTQVADRVKRMGAAGLTHEDEELQEMLGEFEGWLRAAAKGKKDLVFFYY